MKFMILSCEIFLRELCSLVADSPHTCDVQFMPKGLHDIGVEKMVPRLQAAISQVPANTYDAILLAYGLCNNGVVGLQAPDTKLVIPRAHDCITLFMGSRQRYQEYFDEHPGTYYRTTGWYERNDTESVGEITVPQKLGLFMDRDELVRQYGEENADYIMETMGSGVENYDRITFISMGLECETAFRKQAKTEAREKGWSFDEFEGSLSLLRRLCWGEWDDDFLIIHPGQTLQPSHDTNIIKPA